MFNAYIQFIKINWVENYYGGTLFTEERRTLKSRMREILISGLMQGKLEK
jgi:hypothetical protein